MYDDALLLKITQEVKEKKPFFLQRIILSTMRICEYEWNQIGLELQHKKFHIISNNIQHKYDYTKDNVSLIQHWLSIIIQTLLWESCLGLNC